MPGFDAITKPILSRPKLDFLLKDTFDDADWKNDSVLLVLNDGVNVNSDILKSAIPAGLMFITEKSPPMAPNALPTPSVRAVPVGSVEDHRTTSEIFCAWRPNVLIIIHNNIWLIFISVYFNIERMP